MIPTPLDTYLDPVVNNTSCDNVVTQIKYTIKTKDLDSGSTNNYQIDEIEISVQTKTVSTTTFGT